MANLTLTAADVSPVEIFEQWTGPAAEAITKGQMVRIDVTTGKVTLAKATGAAEARVFGMALETVIAGQSVTVVKRGVMDIGDAPNDNSMTYDDDVFLSDTDGTIADTAGSVNTIVGQTVPSWGATTADKLLHIDL